MLLFIEPGPHAVDFGREDGDDFNKVERELFDWGFGGALFENGDFDTEGAANKKDQLAAKSE